MKGEIKMLTPGLPQIPSSHRIDSQQHKDAKQQYEKVKKDFIERSEVKYKKQIENQLNKFELAQEQCTNHLLQEKGYIEVANLLSTLYKPSYHWSPRRRSPRHRSSHDSPSNRLTKAQIIDAIHEFTQQLYTDTTTWVEK